MRKMLLNKTKKIKLIEKTKKADSFFKRFKGLMFSKKPDYALIFDFGREVRIEGSIHMFFVFFPIDLVYLDEKKRVTEIVKGIKPFTLNFTPKKKARYLIEFPEQIIKNKINEGDELQWI